MYGYDDVRRVMAELGVDPDGYNSVWTARNKLRGLAQVVPEELRDSLRKTRDVCVGMLANLDGLEARAVAAEKSESPAGVNSDGGGDLQDA